MFAWNRISKFLYFLYNSYIFFYFLFHSMSYFVLYKSLSPSVFTIFEALSFNVGKVFSANLSANVLAFRDFNVHHKYCYIVKLKDLLSSVLLFSANVLAFRDFNVHYKYCYIVKLKGLLSSVLLFLLWDPWLRFSQSCYLDLFLVSDSGICFAVTFPLFEHSDILLFQFLLTLFQIQRGMLLIVQFFFIHVLIGRSLWSFKSCEHEPACMLVDIFN